MITAVITGILSHIVIISGFASIAALLRMKRYS